MTPASAITIHVGEEGETGAEELGEVIEHLRPERIGHGILAARDPELMRLLREAGTVLEICPTSNLLTKALADEDAVRDTFRTFVENGVAFTIATDGPEMMHTHLRDELELLERIGALTREELETGEPPRPRGELHSSNPSGIPVAARGRWVRDMAARWKLLTALWTVYLVWGSTYVAIKISVRTLPAFLSAGSRFLLAGTLLALILTLRGRSIRVTRRELASSALLGLSLLGLGVGVVTLAETRIDSSTAAMIAGSVPLQVILLRTLARERVALATRLSVLVGLAGLALIVIPGIDGSSSAVGLALMLGATVSWSLGSFFAHRLPLPTRRLRRDDVGDAERGGLPARARRRHRRARQLDPAPSASSPSQPGSTSASSAR